ncbi:hypothetical protein [Marinomonas sp. THO17]|uniref:hypothetical protein n=1 Tax=Marinomonas sp. THO17 TaxID=3149048 RepID=UPI00336BB448
MKKRLTLSCLLLSTILLISCSIQLVSPFDSRSLEQMENIDKDIDRFYLILQSLPESERTYANVSARYIDIEVQIRSLERRQALREKNDETLTQSKTLTSLWQQDIAAHKKNNAISDFIIQRRMDQYRRLMSTLIEGEMAKQ